MPAERDAQEVKAPPLYLMLWIALFIVSFDNATLWRAVLHADGAPRLSTYILGVTLLVIHGAVITVMLSLARALRLLKPAGIALLLIGALSAYFADSYGSPIDDSMLLNVLATDSAEVAELFAPKLLLWTLLIGVFPACVVAWIPLRPAPFRRELLASVLIALTALAGIVGVSLCTYKHLASFARNHREVRYFAAPTNVVVGLIGLARDRIGAGPATLRPVGLDARRVRAGGTGERPRLVLLVVGESARADHFSLNDYRRSTNPGLSREDVVSFRNVSSCGTATAVSLPCMFSPLGRLGYGTSKARGLENLLDVLEHAGVEVIWRDNNSGCKGVCDRVTTEQLGSAVASEGAAYPTDDVLLAGLEERARGLAGDSLIVLHQIGSHGPSYGLRYPADHEVFRPACATNQLQSCTGEEITNAYDNTIAFTDSVLAELVQTLERLSDRFDTAMVYVSDHGESLGEHGLYLHGLPYLVAPAEQTRVPLILWLSPGFERAAGVNHLCLAAQADRPLSHDNLFHSIIGLMGVTTAAYARQSDLLDACTSHDDRRQVADLHNDAIPQASAALAATVSGVGPLRNQPGRSRRR